MGTRRQLTPALPILRRFGRPHARWLVSGLLGTLSWVAFRLAMPWPLAGLIEAAFPGDEQDALGLRVLHELGNPVLVMCALYVVCAIGIGVSELVQRGAMGRFASRTVDDLRAAALRGVAQKARVQELGGGGELIARLVGDAARLREDLRGLVVHAGQNTLLFFAIVIIVLLLSPQMGGFFLVGGVLASAIGYRASHARTKSAGRARAAEGAYAATIDAALSQGNLGMLASSSEEEDDEEDTVASGVLAQPTFQIHLVLAVTVVAALLSGLSRVHAGEMAPAHLFVFAAYALTVHRRLVQVGRQLGRLGKVRATVDRLGSLLPKDDGEPSAVVLRPLFSALRVVGGRVDSARGHGDSPRLRKLDLTIAAGSRVAVLGRPGAGKSSLLRVLAGLEPLAEGALYWDDAPFDSTGRPSLAYVPQDPLFVRQRVSKLLGIDGGEPSDQQRSILDRLGASKAIARLPRGFGDKVGSLGLSKYEGRALALAAVVLGPASVWVLDAPLEGLSRKAAERRLSAIVERAQGRTLIVSMPRLIAAERFDRVIMLKRGKIRFVGTPEQWKARKRKPKEVTSCEG